VTSGSLLARDKTAWTGVPDAVSPDATSSNGTGSAVFRVVTRRGDFGDVDVRFTLVNDRFVTTRRTPARAFDGVHVLLRYASAQRLYAVSVNRRDGRVIVKKKEPGGPSNGGTYFDLTPAVRFPFSFHRPQAIEVRVENALDGSVVIVLRSGGRLVLTAVDRGLGGPPLTAPGKVGIRGDNDEFSFDDFTVTPLAPT